MLKMPDPGSDVEVRCHPGCPWVTGWEVVDVLPIDQELRYRVRRRGQLRPLAAVLPSSDVRPATQLAATRAS